MNRPRRPPAFVPRGPAAQAARAILGLLAVRPRAEPASGGTPAERAQALTQQAARRAAGISATAALAPGPLGLLTLLPDLVGVWTVQAQLVADIAAVYGRAATLSREEVLYCLFRHSSSQLLRDVVVRSGSRFLVRRLTGFMLRRLALGIGRVAGRRALGKLAARFVPLAGAGLVGRYAYLDTQQVAQTAIELFGAETV